MKRIRPYILGIVIAISAVSCTDTFRLDDQFTFADKLRQLPNVVSVTAEESGTFQERYKIFFRQPIDHSNPSAGTFDQLVYLMLNHPDSLNVLVTEGYYAFDAQKVQELVPMFGANQIVVEHRYYGESTIADPTYKYMNADNSSRDLHQIVQSLKPLLGGKWISTGVSKSGLTSVMYRAWYPNDVDLTIPYGAPFCISRYDPRMAEALATSIGTSDQRQRITQFMREALSRRDSMVPLFQSAATSAGIRLPLPANQLWDLHMMDWQAAFWMYSFPIDELPPLTATDQQLFDYIIGIDGPETWDATNDISKYYIQAYSELGHPSFSTAGIEDLLIVDESLLADYLRPIYLPQGHPDTFSPSMHQKVDAFLRTTDSPLLFIYGSYDPWYYVGIGEEYVNGTNILRYVLPGAGHHTFISDFDPATHSEIKHNIQLLLQ